MSECGAEETSNIERRTDVQLTGGNRENGEELQPVTLKWDERDESDESDERDKEAEGETGGNCAMQILGLELSFVQGWQQQARQYRDNRDNDEQFYEGKSGASGLVPIHGDSRFRIEAEHACDHCMRFCWLFNLNVRLGTAIRTIEAPELFPRSILSPHAEDNYCVGRERGNVYSAGGIRF